MAKHAFGAAATAARLRKARERDALVLPIAKALREEGQSLQKVAAALDERQIKTARGGKWSMTSVYRPLQRGRSSP
jgi:acyl-CoA reductase-like NAD-dependent aldehyde dehydrogenase